MKEQKISLFFTEGSSDKAYTAELKAKGDGFVVNFAFGRRGAVLKPGTKTASPVGYEAALKIYNKLVSEKKAKGYTEDESGETFVGSENAGRKTGNLPQLLNPVERADADALVRDASWLMQEKFDGERMMIERLDAGEPQASNRKGLTVPLPAEVRDAVLSIPGSGRLLLDGEFVQGNFVVFDVLAHDGVDLRDKPFEHRVGDQQALARITPKSERLLWAPTAFGSEAKLALWERVMASNGEGVVFRRRSAPYSVGRPDSGGEALKFKFVESATCQVVDVNAGKRSVQVQVFDGSTAVPVGNVTIPANKPIPAPGKLVEVRYLYAFKGGSLFQPVYLGERSDLSPDACSIDQLKFKPEVAAA